MGPRSQSRLAHSSNEATCFDDSFTNSARTRDNIGSERHQSLAMTKLLLAFAFFASTLASFATEFIHPEFSEGTPLLDEVTVSGELVILVLPNHAHSGDRDLTSGRTVYELTLSSPSIDFSRFAALRGSFGVTTCGNGSSVPLSTSFTFASGYTVSLGSAGSAPTGNCAGGSSPQSVEASRRRVFTLRWKVGKVQSIQEGDWRQISHSLLGRKFCHLTPVDLQRAIQWIIEWSTVDDSIPAAIHLDTESKGRILVGEVISTVARAGQISREFSSDQGIDMEIEFKNDAGEATGRKLYLQLKSGNSYLRTRQRDGAEIFEIKKVRHARHWAEQAFPVMLVIRNSEGEVRWMEIRELLRRESDGGKKSVKRIAFTGQRFDVMSVRRWRERVLETGTGSSLT
jgi:hypothetical protein